MTSPGAVDDGEAVVVVGTVVLDVGDDGRRTAPVATEVDEEEPEAPVAGPGVDDAVCPRAGGGPVVTVVDGLVVVGLGVVVVVVVEDGHKVDASEGARGGGSAGVAVPWIWKRHPSTSPGKSLHSAGPTLA